MALAATLVPAIRAARTSTVSALADAARPPRRRSALIALSARLPVPLLLGLRLVARRPRRALLGAASIAVTVTGIVAVLAFHATVNLRISGAARGLGNPVINRDVQMLQILTVVLVALAVLNAVSRPVISRDAVPPREAGNARDRLQTAHRPLQMAPDRQNAVRSRDADEERRGSLAFPVPWMRAARQSSAVAWRARHLLSVLRRHRPVVSPRLKSLILRL